MTIRRVFIGLVIFAAGVVVGHLTALRTYLSHVADLMHEVAESPGTALRVRCLARKYAWEFQYPGPDGEFGAVDEHHVTSANPSGRDLNDPRGRDDVIKSELVLPTDVQVNLETASVDVIHSLGGLPGVIAVDATPGVPERRLFRTSASPITGTLRCVQLCGPGCKDHHAPFNIVSAEEFEKDEK